MIQSRELGRFHIFIRAIKLLRIKQISLHFEKKDINRVSTFTSYGETFQYLQGKLGEPEPIHFLIL